MKKIWKKAGCILLCTIMVLTSAPLQAYEVKAAENNSVEGTVTAEPVSENETESVSEAETGSKTGAEEEVETESKTESEEEVETESKTESEEEAETESKTESEEEAETESMTESEEVETESKTESEEEAETESMTESEEAETESEQEAESETESEEETESELETQEEITQETENETESETILESVTEMVPENEEDGKPVVRREDELTPKIDGEDAIYVNPAFKYSISDEGELDKLKVRVTGISGKYAKPTITLEKDGEKNILCTVKVASGIYDDNVSLEVENDKGKTAKMKLFSMKRNIVENEAPTISLSAMTGDEAYKGQLTNEQIVITVEITGCYSGVKKLEAAFCDGDSKPDGENGWEEITLNPETGKYQIVVGEKLEKKTIPDLSMEAEELTAVNAGSSVASAESNDKWIKNGNYFFRVITRAGNDSADIEYKQRVNIKQVNNAEAVTAYANINYAETGWYNKERPFIKVDSSEAQSSDSKLTTHLKVYKATMENGEKKETKVKEFTLGGEGHQKVTDPMGNEYDYQVNEDGRFIFYVYTTDEVGNIGEVNKYKADVDIGISENIALKVTMPEQPEFQESIGFDYEESGKEDETDDDDNGDIGESSDNKDVIYSHFFGDFINIEIDAPDEVSGIQQESNIWYENGEIGDQKGVLAIDENGRYYVKVTVCDYAGNTATLISDGFIVDDAAPVINEKDELVVKSKGAAKNGFINGDCSIDVSVEEFPEVQNNDYKSAGLKRVFYEIYNSDTKLSEGTILNSELTGFTADQLKEYETASGKIDIKAKELEGNNVTVKVTAVDNAGNSKEATTEVNIDVTQPEITVEFADGATESGKYYTEDRTALITIKELNFDPKGVKLEVTKDGVAEAAAIGGWQSGGDIHTANIQFTEDGEYTFHISCTDFAGNEAKGPEIIPFTIDKTAPEVTISYQTKPYEEGYFNTSVTATIMVEEANFSAKDFRLTAEPQAAIGSWSHNGKVHTASVTFREDGEYTWKVDCTDLAGNRMPEMEPEKFIIDTTMPEVTITGVEDGSANAGEIAPAVTIADEHLNSEDIEIKLTDGRGQVIVPEQKVTQIPQGFHYELTNVSGQKDSVYHLYVKGTDKAGNESELAYRFSLNRNGSTFDLSGVSDLVERVYNQSEDISDIKILETNVDRIEDFEIYINRNGKMIRGAAVSKRPSRYKSDTVYYSVNQRGDENNGYTYEYTIFKENFGEEGTYNITFSSVDRAGNRKNNTQADKEDTIGFIVDDTAPQVYMDGVEGNTVYETDKLDVNVYVTDNFSLKNAEFYLVNESGEKTEVWDYMELAKEAGDSITLTIPESTERRSLLYSVSDDAGNEMVTEVGEKGVPSGFMVTTETVTQVQTAGIGSGNAVPPIADTSGASISEPIVRFAGAVVAGILIIGTAVVIGRRKRLKEFGENS